MTPEEVFNLLTQKIAPRDGRTIGKVDVAIWHEDISDLDFGDACEAVARHFRQTPDTWLKAGHVRAIVRKIREERLGGFQYVAVAGDDDPKVYLECYRAQREAVASGRREAAPALPDVPRRDVAAILAAAFPAMPKAKPQ